MELSENNYGVSMEIDSTKTKIDNLSAKIAQVAPSKD